MIKVITYGTYDLLHHGHIRLLQRAKALGDYLIVGVTSDTFDRERGKINVQQSLMERVEAVKATGIADEIIIEEYEGQKIDDIKRLNVDIFTVGSDWRGKFDYLKAYCRVVYLERTSGVSSTEIRSEQQPVTLGLVGESPILNKIERESRFVNGLEIGHVFSINNKYLSNTLQAADRQAASFEDGRGRRLHRQHPSSARTAHPRGAACGQTCAVRIANGFADKTMEGASRACRRERGCAHGRHQDRLLYRLLSSASARQGRHHWRHCERGRHLHLASKL